MRIKALTQNRKVKMSIKQPPNNQAAISKQNMGLFFCLITGQKAKIQDLTPFL